MSAYYVAYSGWLPRLLRQPIGRAWVYARAVELQARISEELPVASGQAQEDFDASTKIRRLTQHSLPSARVFTGDSIWHLIEYGTPTSPAYRSMANAAESLGYKFVDGGD